MEEKEKRLTFVDKGYFKTPRFLNYFFLIILFMMVSLYLVEQVIDPSGNSFITISLILTAFFVISFTFRLQKVLML